VAHSVSGLISYHSQDADEEFLEMNDFFDLEDLGQNVNCMTTEYYMQQIYKVLFDPLVVEIVPKL